MKKLRLLLVDDQSLFREALRTLLSLQPDFEIVAEAENGEQAIALAKAHRPDVVLMDLRMPVMGGVEATRRLLPVAPGTRVVVLTTFDEDEEVFEALRAGASGYLLKDQVDDVSSLVDPTAIELVKDTSQSRNHYFTTEHNRIVSSRIVNQSRFGFTRTNTSCPWRRISNAPVASTRLLRLE